MNLPLNFTVKQSKAIEELIKDGYKVKKYNGTSFLTLHSKGVEVEFKNK